MFIVNASNRYTLAMTDIEPRNWNYYTMYIRSVIHGVMQEMGYSEDQIGQYFKMSGDTTVTKTHGRKSVGGINRMAMVAEELNLPHVVEIQSVKYKEDQAGKVVVVKKMHDTSFRIACVTPAVLSVNFGCNEPRLATLRSKRAAKSKPLVTYTNAELGFAAEEIGIKGSPTVTVDSFQPETKRSAKMLTGTPAELAKQLYDLIEEEKGK